MTVLVNRDFARHHARSFDLNSFNDNGLEADVPTMAELLYLRRGLTQAGGKLPLFDLDGQEIDVAIVKKCLTTGWAQPLVQESAETRLAGLQAYGTRAAGRVRAVTLDAKIAAAVSGTPATFIMS